MTEPSPTPHPTTPASEPATRRESATAWVIVLLCIALGMALFIFLALIATWAGAPGA